MLNTYKHYAEKDSLLLARCTEIESQCSAANELPYTHELPYTLSDELLCQWKQEKIPPIVSCNELHTTSWSNDYQYRFLRGETLLGLFLFWLIPFLTISGIKVVSQEENAGWRRISVVSSLGLSLVSLIILWNDDDYGYRYGEERFFFLWYSFSLIGLVLPVGLKKIYTWCKSGFIEGQGSSSEITRSANIAENHQDHNSTIEINSDATTIGESSIGLVKAGFWPRFYARCIDLPIALVAVAVISIFVPEFPENGDYFFLSFILNMLINLVILGFTIIFLDAFWISRCGATPGKMLMGLVVMDKNGERPSRATAKARAISFLGGGLYYMLLFPVFQVVGAISAWKKRNDIQPWDGVIGTQVLQKPINKLQTIAVSIIGIMLILTTVIFIQASKQVYQQQMLDESHERLLGTKPTSSILRPTQPHLKYLS